jgi:hypothetical protein
MEEETRLDLMQIIRGFLRDETMNYSELKTLVLSASPLMITDDLRHY